MCHIAYVSNNGADQTVYKHLCCLLLDSKICLLSTFIRGPFGKYVAWSFFSVTDQHTHSCLVSFSTAICPLCQDINFMIML